MPFSRFSHYEHAYINRRLLSLDEDGDLCSKELTSESFLKIDPALGTPKSFVAPVSLDVIGLRYDEATLQIYTSGNAAIGRQATHYFFVTARGSEGSLATFENVELLAEDPLRNMTPELFKTMRTLGNGLMVDSLSHTAIRKLVKQAKDLS